VRKIDSDIKNGGRESSPDSIILKPICHQKKIQEKIHLLGLGRGVDSRKYWTEELWEIVSIKTKSKNFVP